MAAVALIGAGAFALGWRDTPAPPPPASPSASDRDAPASLVEAANAVGFHPTTEAGVGRIESKPASAALPPFNSKLLPVGSRAPSFRLRTPQGHSVSLAGTRGQAVLLEFFATWCPHCNAEAPHLRALANTLPKQRYAFLSIDADGENAASVFAFHRYYGLPYAALLDPSAHPGSFSAPGAPGPVSTRYRVESYPTFYVLAPDGRIVWRSDGEQPDALLRHELKLAGARRRAPSR
jgi:peroxiredoxin